MPVYDVDVYRKIRLSFHNVRATTPDQAATYAARLGTEMADTIYAASWDTLAARVRDAGDAGAGLMIPFHPEALTLLEEAVAAWDEAFADDQPVDGGDLVEWFAQWLPRVQAVLAAVRSQP